MNYKRLALGAALVALFVMGLAGVGVRAAFAALSDVSPSTVQGDTNTLYWSGQGIPVQQLCGPSADFGAGAVPNGATANSYLLWIFTTDGGGISGSPTLSVNGQTYTGAFNPGVQNPDGSTGAWQIVTPYIDPATITPGANGTAFVNFTVASTGNGKWVLTISHGCAGVAQQDLTVTKTATPSFTRTYTWHIAKSTSTPTVYTAGGAPGSADYSASVSHDPPVDSAFAVSGKITVSNPNASDVSGVNVTDSIDNGGSCSVQPSAGGVDPGSATIPANASVDFPYTCTFTANPGSGTNTATATWPNIGSPGTSANGTAPYDFGSVTPTIVDDSVAVTDSLGGSLGTVSVTDANPTEITYSATVTGDAGTCTSNPNTATFTTDTTKTQGSDSATVSDCQGADLTVTKTATPAFTRTYGWTITKSASPATVKIDPWASATFNYTVAVTHDNGTDSAWAVSGTITVKNPNDWEDVSGVNVSDSIDNNGSCTVRTGSGGADPTNATIPKGGSVDFPYTCTFTANPGSGTNTATATWNAATYHTPDGTKDGTASYTFGAPTTVKGNCFTATDSFNGGSPLTLGVACIDPSTTPPSGSWTTDPGNTLASFQETFSDPTFTLTYSRTIHAPGAGTCATYPNTAKFTSNNGDTGSASASVQVCAFQAPLTIGYWGNHLAPNGTTGCTGLPSGTGCSSNGPWANKYLPQPLGGYSVTTFQTVAKVIAANNCSNATTSAQNAVGCLAAQLLAAELNVAFGANTCIITNANGINAANAFLSTIPYIGPTSTYTLTTAQRNQALTLKNELVNYNQGGGC